MDQGPGVHLEGKGWNETKNAILVSAESQTSAVDPQPDPPACFLNSQHVAKLTETAKTRENTGESDDLPEQQASSKAQRKCRAKQPPHKPKRLLRTVLSSMRPSRQFGAQMQREARRRRFDEASRQAFLGDGLACNWTIHETYFPKFVPILDFTHAVTYLFRAAALCTRSREEAWSVYADWMTKTWRGQVLNLGGTLYYLCSVLDGSSRYIVHHEICESMTEPDVETFRAAWPT